MKSSLKKVGKIGGIMCLVILTAISMVLLSYLFRPVSKNRKNIDGFYAQKTDSLDMVYIGGSACYYFWEPLEAFQQHGFTSYNFAADAMPPQIIKYCIKEVLKTQTPELLVVDLRPFQYGDTYDEESQRMRYLREAPLRNVIDNMKYSYNRFEAIKHCVPDEENKAYYYFDLAKYHSLVTSIVNKENWKHILNEYPLESRGFSYLDSIHSYEKEDYSHIKKEMPLADVMDKMFIDLLEYCKEEKLQVLFVVVPYTIPKQDQMKYNYMRQKIQEYGFDFLNANDYTTDMGLDFATDFADGVHVNLLGADKYTAFLGEYLSEKYNFEDKRSVLEYAEWRQDYEVWLPEIENARKELLGDKH